MAQEMNPVGKFRLHVVIEGRVQGVGFRYFIADKALELDLCGWVRNTFSGEVEVCAEGEKNLLEQLLDALRQGPRSAFVTALHQDWLPATGEWVTFTVKPTI